MRAKGGVSEVLDRIPGGFGGFPGVRARIPFFVPPFFTKQCDRAKQESQKRGTKRGVRTRTPGNLRPESCLVNLVTDQQTTLHRPNGDGQGNPSKDWSSLEPRLRNRQGTQSNEKSLSRSQNLKCSPRNPWIPLETPKRARGESPTCSFESVIGRWRRTKTRNSAYPSTSPSQRRNKPNPRLRHTVPGSTRAAPGIRPTRSHAFCKQGTDLDHKCKEW